MELSSLREEESKMEQQVEGGKQQLELLVKSQGDLQLQISQVIQGRYTNSLHNVKPATPGM